MLPYLIAAIIVVGPPTLYVAVRYREYRKFLAGAFFVSSGMQIGGDLVALTPGMAVTAKIKTGNRRVISYLFSPLVSYQHGALRAR